MNYLDSISQASAMMSFSRHERRSASDAFQASNGGRESNNGADSRSFARILDRMLAR